MVDLGAFLFSGVVQGAGFRLQASDFKLQTSNFVDPVFNTPCSSLAPIRLSGSIRSFRLLVDQRVIVRLEFAK